MILCDVITIVRNAESNIHETLNSVSNQDYRKINHIIVDGHSTDLTVQIINSFPHNKTCEIHTQESTGITAAFNEGLRYVTGDLVVFLNAGDLFINSQVIAQVVESYKNNKWLWASGETISLSRRKYLKRYIKQYDQWQQELFLYGNPICHQSTIFSQAILSQIGLYDEQLYLEADYDFNVRASLISQPYLFRFPISYYDTTGISSIKVFQSYIIQKRLRKKYFPLTYKQNLIIDSICFIKAIKRFLLIPIKLYL
ncbi:MAG: glycosyltransferase [Nostoc sp.]|uniref:glycosyltransferase n=1 Tax=Nostoc sp. TaxID=1180 RepID=UPI002FF991C8